MKKLITTAMALALAAGFAVAQVTSDNIVGYTKIVNPLTGSTYPPLGNCFITAGSENAQVTLGEIIAEGMDPTVDYIQFLNPANASTYLTATYIDADTAAGLDMDEGWYDDFTLDPLNATVLPAGTAFLGNFSSGAVTITFAGEVVQDEIVLDMTGKTYPLIANVVPMALTLGDVVAAGMDPTVDYIQFLNPANASTYLTATYIDADTAAGLDMDEGWYDDFTLDPLNATVLPAGAAFLGNFSSGAVTLTFPNPLAP